MPQRPNAARPIHDDAKEPDPSEPDITELLSRYSAGEHELQDKIFPIVYAKLRAMAGSHLKRERNDHTLQPTALVNEVFLALVRQSEKSWQSRAHFFAVASLAMRQILVGYARHRLAKKRGGDAIRVNFDEKLHATDKDATELLSLNDALAALERENPRQGRIVEMRFFGGMSIEETASALEISTGTVKREWNVARAWLFRALETQREG